MTLRPGCAPARLLLQMWRLQASGSRWHILPPRSAFQRLLQLEFIQVCNQHYSLTQAGRYAAQTLDAGSR